MLASIVIRFRCTVRSSDAMWSISKLRFVELDSPSPDFPLLDNVTVQAVPKQTTNNELCSNELRFPTVNQRPQFTAVGGVLRETTLSFYLLSHKLLMNNAKRMGSHRQTASLNQNRFSKPTCLAGTALLPTFLHRRLIGFLRPPNE